MEQLLFSLNATIPVFLVMVIGYVLQQLHVTNDSFVKTLNSFNYKITLDHGISIDSWIKDKLK